jgi:hypothetical protein
VAGFSIYGGWLLLRDEGRVHGIDSFHHGGDPFCRVCFHGAASVSGILEEIDTLETLLKRSRLRRENSPSRLMVTRRQTLLETGGTVVRKSPLFMITALATVLAVLVAINPFGRNLVSPHPTETTTPKA